MLVNMQLAESESDGVFCQTTGQNEAVDAESYLVPGCFFCVKASVECHLPDVDHREKGILTIGIYDMRMFR